jgi:hypothetical protein
VTQPSCGLQTTVVSQLTDQEQLWKCFVFWLSSYCKILILQEYPPANKMKVTVEEADVWNTTTTNLRIRVTESLRTMREDMYQWIAHCEKTSAESDNNNGSNNIAQIVNEKHTNKRAHEEVRPRIRFKISANTQQLMTSLAEDQASVESLMHEVFETLDSV